MYKHLYDVFKRWYHGGSIYFIGDTHFGDLESYKFRFNQKMIDLEPIDEEETIKLLDQMQIDNINSVCHKCDTLVILGDVGDIECVKKLKAGHKVLILGNHDRGASYYQRVRMVKISEDLKRSYIDDNHLFDEVYKGTLQISPKIILSHEPCNYNYALNIHGHVHSQKEFNAYCESVIDCQLDGSVIERNIYSLNVCAELINYKPISLKEIVNMGLLKDVADIHREVIDNKD